MNLWDAGRAHSEGKNVQSKHKYQSMWLPFETMSLDETVSERLNDYYYRLAPEPTPAEKFLEKFPIGTMIYWKSPERPVEVIGLIDDELFEGRNYTGGLVIFGLGKEFGQIDVEDNWKRIEERKPKKRLMTPAELIGKFVHFGDDGVYMIHGANDKSIYYGVYHYSLSGLKVGNDEYKGWSHTIDGELNESFEVVED